MIAGSDSLFDRGIEGHQGRDGGRNVTLFEGIDEGAREMSHLLAAEPLVLLRRWFRGRLRGAGLEPRRVVVFSPGQLPARIGQCLDRRRGAAGEDPVAPGHPDRDAAESDDAGGPIVEVEDETGVAVDAEDEDPGGSDRSRTRRRRSPM